MLTQLLRRWVRPLCRPTRRAPYKTALHLETLEDRRTPSVAPNAVFVASLYDGLLGRPVEPAGLAGWTAALDAGLGRAQVAQAIATSPEAYAHDVNLFYKALLGRNAEPSGLASWTGQLEAGATLDQVKGGILGSPEFFKRAGGNDVAFLVALYQDELSRPVDVVGLMAWDPLLHAGAMRNAVADAVLGSFEASEVKTTNFYVDTLARKPGSVWLLNFSSTLQAGVSESEVLGLLLGSDEYFGRVAGAAAGAATDPNQAALGMIQGAGLFTGPLPNAEYLVFQPAGPLPAPTPPPDDSAPWPPTDVVPQPTWPVFPPVISVPGTDNSTDPNANNIYNSPSPTDTTDTPPVDTTYTDTTPVSYADPTPAPPDWSTPDLWPWPAVTATDYSDPYANWYYTPDPPTTDWNYTPDPPTTDWSYPDTSGSTDISYAWVDYSSPDTNDWGW